MDVERNENDLFMEEETSLENQPSLWKRIQNFLPKKCIYCVLVAGLIVVGIVLCVIYCPIKPDLTPPDENNTSTDPEKVKVDGICIGRLYNKAKRLNGMSCNVTAGCFKQTDVSEELNCTNILGKNKLTLPNGTHQTITCCDKICICNMENYCNDGSAICAERDNEDNKGNKGIFTCHDCPLGKRGEQCQDDFEKVKVKCECYKTFPPNAMESCAQMTYPAEENCIIKRTGKEYGICMCNTSIPLNDDQGLPDCVP